MVPQDERGTRDEPGACALGGGKEDSAMPLSAGGDVPGAPGTRKDRTARTVPGDGAPGPASATEGDAAGAPGAGGVPGAGAPALVPAPTGGHDRDPWPGEADTRPPTASGLLPRQAETLLVIEGDPSGAASLPDLLHTEGEGGSRVRVRTARNLTEAARLLTDDVHCILLDLATGDLDVLREVLRMAPRQAVLVLTGEDDADRAAEAVRIGAQDQLFRHELDSRLLTRAIRCAVERKRADLAQRQLSESRLRAQENARLERGLLPTPLLDGSGLDFASRYRPGRSRALLGGDFYDTVRTADGTVHVVIGDVCGHGPDEAALGVELRIAWRALVFAGILGAELLGILQRVLEHERASDEIFATLCMVDIAPQETEATVWLAGHPAPVLANAEGGPRLLREDLAGPALGLLPQARWPHTRVRLGEEWSLLLYTDGLIEGRTGPAGERLGQDGMLGLVGRGVTEGRRGQEFLDGLVGDVCRLNGGEQSDDLAVLLLGRVPGRGTGDD
ncbi:PP2C family protein-serine/threonine phosphatase [Streptomyces tardus]